MSDNVIGEEMHVVTATRNAVEARKWIASRLMPHQYGDRPAGVSISNNTKVMFISDEKLRSLQETRRQMMLEQANTREA